MVKAEPNFLEIEIDGPKNQSLMFRPLNRTLRGRFDFNRVREPLARTRTAEWPEPIPGMRLGINADTGEAYVIDQIHESEEIKRKLAEAGYALPQEREEFQADVTTFVFWMKRAVESGVAKLVRGVFPEKLEGKPRRNFIIPEQPSSTDKLAEALENNTRVMAEILNRLTENK